MTTQQRPTINIAPQRQSGFIAVIVAIGMVALLSAAALAFDVGHLVLSKTRLQNAVDAAALAGAKEIDSSGDTVQATAATLSAFLHNAGASGNHDLLDYYNNGGTVEVEFSATLYPFVSGTTPPEFVRVRVRTLPLDIWIASIIGVTEKSVAATAVGGPSAPLGPDSNACNLAPIVVCGDPDAAEDTHFGYTLNDIQVLKSASQDGDFQVGPGNFQLVLARDGQDDADIRENLAGSYNSCLSSANDIETEPGVTVDPIAEGLNTRLGTYTGPMNGTEDTYPADAITTENTVEIEFDEDGHVTTSIEELDFDYEMYTAQAADGPYDHTPAPDGPGHFQRRILALPVGDCTATADGQGLVPLLGYACFFLLQAATQLDNESQVYGQFIQDCRAAGTPGPQPGGGVAGTGPHVIQLYEDPDSSDS